MSFVDKHKQAWAANRAANAAAQLGAKPVAAVSVATKPMDKKQRSEFEILVKKISEDRNILQSTYAEHPERNAATPPVLAKYMEYLEAAIKDGKYQDQDPIIVQGCIWAVNTADFELATQLATMGIAMDSGMKRNLPTLVFDMTLQDERSSDDDKLRVLAIVEAEEWEINKPALAKIYKWAAQHFEESDLSKACGYAEAAHETYPNVGVKTFMETLQKRVAAEAAPKTGE